MTVLSAAQKQNRDRLRAVTQRASAAYAAAGGKMGGAVWADHVRDSWRHEERSDSPAAVRARERNAMVSEAKNRLSKPERADLRDINKQLRYLTAVKKATLGAHANLYTSEQMDRIHDRMEKGSVDPDTIRRERKGRTQRGGDRKLIRHDTGEVRLFDDEEMRAYRADRAARQRSGAARSRSRRSEG